MTLPLIDIPLQDVYFEDSGVELLTNGDFSAWTGAGNAQTPTGWTKTSPDTAANHVEQNPVGMCRLISDGTAVTLAQTPCAVGGQYVARLVVPSFASGILAVFSSATLYNLTTSGTYELNLVADNPNFGIKRGIIAPNDWTVDNISLHARLAKTKNIGSLGGSLELGTDGITPSTFPTIIGGGKRGFKTLSNGYGSISHLTCPALGSTGTVYALIDFSPATLAAAAAHGIFTQGPTSSGYATGVLLNQNTNSLQAFWGSAGNLVQFNAMTPGVHSVAMTCDGSLVRLYWDGVSVGTPTAPGGASVRTGMSIGCPRVIDSFTGPISSRIYDAKVFSYALEETQIRNLHQRSLARVNLY